MFHVQCSGELDGLTRASRIAVEFEKMKTLPSELHYVKPVVILPGVCHSQFCEGVNVTSFGTKDLRPDVTWEVRAFLHTVRVRHLINYLNNIEKYL